MKVAKAIKLDTGKVPSMEEPGFEEFKSRLLKIAHRYGAIEIKFFDQDGTNIRDNKVTVVFYAQS